jgi:hypothetical protein
MEKFRAPCNSYARKFRFHEWCPPKWSSSERVVNPGIGSKKCTEEAVRWLNAGELAGSSFSRLGVAFLRVQAPGPQPSVLASYSAACLREVACLLTEV